MKSSSMVKLWGIVSLRLMAVAVLMLSLIFGAIRSASAVDPIYPIALATPGALGTGVNGGNNTIPFALSGDGRYVTFEASAPDVMAGDTNTAQNAFMYDRDLATTIRLSATASGVQTGGGQPLISDDGNVAVFISDSTAFNPGGFGSGLYKKDLTTGTVTPVSTASLSSTVRVHANNPDMTPQGRWVTWWSDANSLVPSDTNNQPDAFLKDTLTNITTRVSVNSTGDQALNGMTRTVKISADGRYIAFWSQATNLVDNDNDLCYNDPVVGKCPDIFRHDTLTGATEMVSIDELGAPADIAYGEHDMSDDGSVVAFDSSLGIHVWQASTGVATIVPGTEGCGGPSLSGDGARLAYHCSFPFGNGGNTDIYFIDLADGNIHLVTQSPAGELANGPSFKALLSSDGQSVAFHSTATNLVGTPVLGGGRQIYLASLVNPDSTPPSVTNVAIDVNPKSISQTATLSANVSDTQSDVSEVEYFIGADPGQGNGASMAFSSGVATAAIGTDFPVGIYSFSVRALDNAGNWSAPAQVNLDVYDPDGGYVAGHGFIEPNGSTSEPGDHLPTVSGNNIKSTLDFTVEYIDGSATIPTGDSSFTYGSGNCKKVNNSCFVVTTDSFAWLIVDQTANTAVFQGAATLALNGQSQGSNHPVRVSVANRNHLNLPDRYILRIYAQGANPNTASPLYQASGDLTGGNIVLHQ